MYAACKFEFQLVGLCRGWGWWGRGEVRGSWICGRRSINIIFTQECQKLDELDNWKLVFNFLYLHCFDWRRIKFDVNIV